MTPPTDHLCSVELAQKQQPNAIDWQLMDVSGEF